MKKYTLIGLIFLVTVIVGAVSSFEVNATKGISVRPIPSAGLITIEGTIVCLPHKDTSGPQTLECAFGLKDTKGQYFALKDSDPSYKNISSVPMNTDVSVEGTFTPEENKTYNSIGVITVTRIVVVSINRGIGTIQGKVIQGPICPFFKNPPETNCADQPYQTLVAVFPSNDLSHAIALTNSDANGNFQFSLAPGTYMLGAGESNLPQCNHPEVTVTKNETATVTIDCDTGIR